MSVQTEELDKNSNYIWKLQMGNCIVTLTLNCNVWMLKSAASINMLESTTASSSPSTLCSLNAISHQTHPYETLPSTLSFIICPLISWINSPYAEQAVSSVSVLLFSEGKKKSNTKPPKQSRKAEMLKNRTCKHLSSGKDLAQSRYLNCLLRQLDGNEGEGKHNELLNTHCNFNNYYLNLGSTNKLVLKKMKGDRKYGKSHLQVLNPNILSKSSSSSGAPWPLKHASKLQNLLQSSW